MQLPIRDAERENCDPGEGNSWAENLTLINRE